MLREMWRDASEEEKGPVLCMCSRKGPPSPGRTMAHPQGWRIAPPLKAHVPPRATVMCRRRYEGGLRVDFDNF